MDSTVLGGGAEPRQFHDKRACAKSIMHAVHPETYWVKVIVSHIQGHAMVRYFIRILATARQNK